MKLVSNVLVIHVKTHIMAECLVWFPRSYLLWMYWNGYRWSPQRYCKWSTLLLQIQTFWFCVLHIFWEIGLRSRNWHKDYKRNIKRVWGNEFSQSISNNYAIWGIEGLIFWLIKHLLFISNIIYIEVLKWMRHT